MKVKRKTSKQAKKRLYITGDKDVDKVAANFQDGKITEAELRRKVTSLGGDKRDTDSMIKTIKGK